MKSRNRKPSLCHPGKPNASGGICHDCWHKQKLKTDPKFWRARRTERLRRKYGITSDEYDKILDSQNGGCAICGVDKCQTGRKMVVDHDHLTGRVRGILCNNCNAGIGHLKDSPKILDLAAIYLRNDNHYTLDKAKYKQP